MTNAAAPDSDRYTTSGLSAASGYSVQQIRDLERLDVIPPASRQPNGYRQFASIHVIALRAYRHLAIAVGPVIARATMGQIRQVPSEEAISRIVTLHVELARSRDDTIAALHALDSDRDRGDRVRRLSEQAAGKTRGSKDLRLLCSSIGRSLKPAS